ncbi:MAG: hypothetical protein J6W30_00790 [Bacteroidales bacterium]|nr:hypothetical protein [Bacteroidales bacterium]
MKKYFFVIVVTFLLSLTPSFGQMILTEEDAGLNNRAGSSHPPYVMVPLQNVNYDQWDYAPLGNCIWLLAGMGGAYLIQKKRRQK